MDDYAGVGIVCRMSVLLLIYFFCGMSLAALVYCFGLSVWYLFSILLWNERGAV